MKTIQWLPILLLFLIGNALTACSSQDAPDEQEPTVCPEPEPGPQYDSSLTGTWYADKDLANGYSYYFGKEGSGLLYTFDTQGHSIYQTFTWENINQSKVQIRFDKTQQEVSYQITNEQLTLFTSDGSKEKGHFTRQNQYGLLGSWKSVYTESGTLTTGEERSGVVELAEKSFYSETIEEGKKTKRYYALRFFEYNQYLHLSEDGGTEAMLSYRFSYHKDTKKVYLEITNQKDFSRYVEYEKSAN